MFATAAPPAPVTATSTTTTSLPLSLSMTSPHDIQLKDCTLGDTVCAQEWIARELGRIQQNTKPRHCHDYEALLQVIDDMSRFLQAPGGAAAAAAAAVASATGAPQQQAPILRLVDLENALVRVVRYSQRHNKNHHQSHPSRLVLALDSMVTLRQRDGGKITDVASAQKRIFSILFGQVQLTSKLVEPWKMICQWAKQLVHARDGHVWMGYGLDAYVKAKQRCHLTVEAGTIIINTAENPSSTLSTPTSATSTSPSSISTTSSTTNTDYQIMLEQLQGLLVTTNSNSNNTSNSTTNSPLVEKYSV